ncbi:MAG: hypothetical protein J3K34DRAFT_424936 [Monoraphidium minutum]|nr:MAG: hypothetical protein J3K34DRAFT_424936 [Monoraphidium minutum]
MLAANAEGLARKEGGLVGAERGVKPLLAVSAAALDSADAGAKWASVLQRQGCLGLQGALSHATAARLLTFVEEENARCQADVEAGRAEFDARFGGVNCRGMRGRFGQRQDLFMPLSAPPVRAAVGELVHSLRPLLEAAVGPDAALHEVSCIVAQPGAPRQCVHADTIVLPCPQYPAAAMEPLYTFFVALQDISDDMGHTQFLPYTHTSEAHLLWNAAGKSATFKDRFISMQPAAQSALRTGDVSAFDSRVLHCGCANASAKQRVLFYITLSRQAEWPLPNGLHGSNSIRAEDLRRWKLPDLLAMREGAGAAAAPAAV